MNSKSIPKKDQSKYAAIYARKSKFSEKGESISNQLNRGKALCESRGWKYKEYKDTDYSGKNLDRPDFERMYKDIENGLIHTVICYKLDRVSRSVNDFSTLITDLTDKGVNFVSLTENFDTSTPLGRAMMYISSVFAQLERETISERVKDNMYDLFAAGRWVGGKIPMGYDSENITVNGRKASRLLINKNEAAIVKYIFDEYVKDGSSTLTVARDLISKGIKSKNNQNLSSTAIARILSNHFYVQADEHIYEYFSGHYKIVGDKDRFDGTCGCQSYGKSSVTIADRKKNDKSNWQLTAGSHEWIVPSDLFLAVQEKMRIKRRMPPRKGTSKNSILTGLVKCGSCGASMTLRKSSAKDVVYRYMYCPSKGRFSPDFCDQKNIRVDILEKNVVDLIVKLSSDKDELRNALIQSLNDLTSKKNPLTDGRESSLNRIAQIDSDLKRMLDLLVREIVAEDAYKEKVNSLSTEKDHLQNFINNSKSRMDEIEYSELNIQHILGAVETMPRLAESKDFDEKRSLIRSIVKEIIINGDDAEVVFFFNIKTLENMDCDRLSISLPLHQ